MDNEIQPSDRAALLSWASTAEEARGPAAAERALRQLLSLLRSAGLGVGLTLLTTGLAGALGEELGPDVSSFLAQLQQSADDSETLVLADQLFWALYDRCSSRAGDVPEEAEVFLLALRAVIAPETAELVVRLLLSQIRGSTALRVMAAYRRSALEASVGELLFGLRDEPPLIVSDLLGAIRVATGGTYALRFGNDEPAPELVDMALDDYELWREKEAPVDRAREADILAAALKVVAQSRDEREVARDLMRRSVTGSRTEADGLIEVISVLDRVSLSHVRRVAMVAAEVRSFVVKESNQFATAEQVALLSWADAAERAWSRTDVESALRELVALLRTQGLARGSVMFAEAFARVAGGGLTTEIAHLVSRVRAARGQAASSEAAHRLYARLQGVYLHRTNSQEPLSEAAQVLLLAHLALLTPHMERTLLRLLTTEAVDIEAAMSTGAGFDQLYFDPAKKSMSRSTSLRLSWFASQQAVLDVTLREVMRDKILPEDWARSMAVPLGTEALPGSDAGSGEDGGAPAQPQQARADGLWHDPMLLGVPPE